MAGCVGVIAGCVGVGGWVCRGGWLGAYGWVAGAVTNDEHQLEVRQY